MPNIQLLCVASNNFSGVVPSNWGSANSELLTYGEHADTQCLNSDLSCLPGQGR